MTCFATPVNHASVRSPCCEPCHEETTPQWFLVIEQITAVALAVFAYQVSAELFIPFVLVGTAIGLYQALTSEASELDHGARMGCSRGLMEQLTGIKLPRLVSLATDVAVMWCHIDHHATVFVPMIALYTGAKLALSGTTLAQKCCSEYLETQNLSLQVASPLL